MKTKSKESKYIQVYPIKLEILNFMRVVENYFHMTPDMFERMKFLFLKVWSNYSMQKTIKYENAVIAILIFIQPEFETSDNNTPIDISEFMTFLFGANAKNNTIQVYNVYQNLQTIFNDKSEK